MPAKKKSPADVTGTKSEKLRQEHAAELKQREAELATINQVEAEQKAGVVDYTTGTPREMDDGDEVTDLTGPPDQITGPPGANMGHHHPMGAGGQITDGAGDPVTDMTGRPYTPAEDVDQTERGLAEGFNPAAVRSLDNPDGPLAIEIGDAEGFREDQSRHLVRGATKQPGQTGVAIDASGVMTDTAQPGWSVKTNDKPVSGTGTETPSAVPGGTIADQRVRPSVDDKNVAMVGGVSGPDPIAPVPFSAAGDVRTVENPTRVIRLNTSLDEVTIGAGRTYTFEEGRQYKVPAEVADHLEEKGYVYH